MKTATAHLARYTAVCKKVIIFYLYMMFNKINKLIPL